MSLSANLLAWYDKNARELPWRSVTSPYQTWVSEIMLQQTQVDTVIPYFLKWMARFPNIESLASADEQEVLSLWEGLGYYSRARNLHKAAQVVVNSFDGKLPDKISELEKLPGIGPYTAAAIASIAFDQDVAAVDGNIRRVLARYFNMDLPARSPEGERLISKLAHEHLPKGRAGDHNQALMDLGATICTNKNPVCSQCPLSEDCISRKLDLQSERPVTLPRKKIPHLTVTAAVIYKAGKVLIAQRPKRGLLGGLWEFPGGTLEKADVNLEGCLTREIKEELGVNISIVKPFGEYRHAYTHFKITLFAFVCELPEGEIPRAIFSDQLAWADLKQLPAYPMGKVDREIARRLIKEFGDGSLPG